MTTAYDPVFSYNASRAAIHDADHSRAGNEMSRRRTWIGVENQGSVGRAVRLDRDHVHLWRHDW